MSKRRCSHAVKEMLGDGGYGEEWTCGFTQTRFRHSAICDPDICPTYMSGLATRNIEFYLSELYKLRRNGK